MSQRNLGKLNTDFKTYHWLEYQLNEQKTSMIENMSVNKGKLNTHDAKV